MRGGDEANQTPLAMQHKLAELYFTLIWGPQTIRGYKTLVQQFEHSHFQT